VYIAPTRANCPRRRPTEGFLVLDAAAASGGGSGFTTILFLLLLFGVVYFLMIRPQQKRRREALSMQNAIGVGDRIVTIGGLHATIIEMSDDIATVEIAPGVVVQFARAAIAKVLPADDTIAETEEPLVADEPAVDEPLVEEPVQSPVVDTRKKD
jgi:preprotein translocase subunit YajC